MHDEHGALIPPPVAPYRTVAAATLLSVTWSWLGTMEVVKHSQQLFHTGPLPAAHECAHPTVIGLMAVVAAVHLLVVWPCTNHAIVYAAALLGMTGMAAIEDDTHTMDVMRFAMAVLSCIVQVLVTVTVPWEKFLKVCVVDTQGGRTQGEQDNIPRPPVEVAGPEEELAPA